MVYMSNNFSEVPGVSTLESIMQNSLFNCLLLFLRSIYVCVCITM